MISHVLKNVFLGMLLFSTTSFSQSITVLSPNGNETLTGCTNYLIKWSQEGVKDYVYIDYSIDGGALWTNINYDYIGDNTNSYLWNVPSLNTTKLKIRVRGYFDSSIKDSSDFSSNIITGQNFFSLTSPNGGESLIGGSLHTINWNSNGNNEDVSLKYSINKGATWDWVRDGLGNAANKVPNIGSYAWQIPLNIESTECLIHVYQYSKTCVLDFSNSFFTISTNTGPITSLNTEEIRANSTDFNVFPNPNTGYSFEWELLGAKQISNVRIRIFNLLGVVVFEKDSFLKTTDSVYLGHPLNSGIYMVECQTPAGIFYENLLVK